jgi:1-deoxy-D-xylulose-5-phosphate reductoisomerase
VYALSCDKRVDVLELQIKEFSPKIAVTTLESDALKLAKKYKDTEFYFGTDGLVCAATSDCDLVLNALVGISGLLPTYEAVLKGKEIALANKETLVAGGSVIMEAIKKHGAKLLPVDSEHNAIFQCLCGNSQAQVRKLILTASGGPFRGWTLQQLEKVTVEQALNHPNWSMGSKITIDSATMMNKGLEIIEAKWLFDIPENKIEVAVHPQSIVHSMVEYYDGSVIAQMGKPDMRVPISYALGYPERIESEESGPDFFKEAKNLTFEKPDEDTFRCLKMARFAIKDEHSSYAVVLNAANEVLVKLFLDKKIGFLDIQRNIEKVLEAHKPEYNQDIGAIIELDEKVRKECSKDVIVAINLRNLQ